MIIKLIKDKRIPKQKRKSVKMLAAYNLDSGSRQASIINLSDKGMGFESNDPLTVGSEIFLQMMNSFDNGTCLIQGCVAEIRWAEKIDNAYRYGVHIKSMIEDCQNCNKQPSEQDPERTLLICATCKASPVQFDLNKMSFSM
jgi:hypothetical protein